MLKKNTRSLIRTITLASILEWHELVLFIYWAPYISQLFFRSTGHFSDVINSLFIFAVGFLARPLGGYISGFLGNKYGRRGVLIWSIVIISFATLAIGFIPTYLEVGYLSWIILGVLRFIQNLSAGAELPGAICYLYESSKVNKVYISSYALVGPAIGGISAILECVLIRSLMSNESLLEWGWRLSFIIGGLFGILALFLRKSLEETPSFEQLREQRAHQEIQDKGFFRKHTKSSIKGIFCTILEIVGYVMLALVTVLYRSKFDYAQSIIIIAAALLFSVLITPLIGMIGQKIGNLKMLKWSAAIIAVISYPLYLITSLTSVSLGLSILAVLVFIVLITMQFALIPSLIAQLFPTSARYMGIGLSFNLCDSLLVGFVPVAIVFLSKYTGIVSACSIILSVSALISFVSFFFVTEKYVD